MPDDNISGGTTVCLDIDCSQTLGSDSLDLTVTNMLERKNMKISSEMLPLLNNKISFPCPLCAWLRRAIVLLMSAC